MSISHHLKSVFAPSAAIALLLFCGASFAQNDILPPSLGQETKGNPAHEAIQQDKEAIQPAATKGKSKKTNALGTTKITESKRENGQLYLIELDSSLGAKQYIEETDSDGKIESTSNDIEETPNLPKWKLGSW